MEGFEVKQLFYAYRGFSFNAIENETNEIILKHSYLPGFVKSEFLDIGALNNILKTMGPKKLFYF